MKYLLVARLTLRYRVTTISTFSSRSLRYGLQDKMIQRALQLFLTVFQILCFLRFRAQYECKFCGNPGFTRVAPLSLGASIHPPVGVFSSIDRKNNCPLRTPENTHISYLALLPTKSTQASSSLLSRTASLLAISGCNTVLIRF